MRDEARRKRRLFLRFFRRRGLDVAITLNFFPRGEFEYVQFAPISNITASISTVRGGAGFKL